MGPQQLNGQKSIYLFGQFNPFQVMIEHRSSYSMEILLFSIKYVVYSSALAWCIVQYTIQNFVQIRQYIIAIFVLYLIWIWFWLLLLGRWLTTWGMLNTNVTLREWKSRLRTKLWIDTPDGNVDNECTSTQCSISFLDPVILLPVFTTFRAIFDSSTTLFDPPK